MERYPKEELMPKAKPTIREMLRNDSPSLNRSRQINLQIKSLTDSRNILRREAFSEEKVLWQSLQIYCWTTSLSSIK
ncbi:MAG: hypothetical protein QME49_10135 [bacterium]|nr:hypothetical protein [bacterium]